MDDSNSVQTELYEKIPEQMLKYWRLGPLRFATSFPEVELSGDVITLRWGEQIIRARIANCQFRIGRAWQMKRNARSARPLLPFGNSDLILIDFPPLKKTFFGRIYSYNTAPVGYTKESLAKWNAALGNVLGKARRK